MLDYYFFLRQGLSCYASYIPKDLEKKIGQSERSLIQLQIFEKIKEESASIKQNQKDTK